MSGQYVRQIHRCDVPPVVGTGDLWRCDCGRLWRSVWPDRWVRLTWLERSLRGLR